MVGRLVEVLSGMPLDAYLQERIFQPLGMVDTAFVVPEGKRARFASCWAATPQGLMDITEATNGAVAICCWSDACLMIALAGRRRVRGGRAALNIQIRRRRPDLHDQRLLCLLRLPAQRRG